MHGDGLRILHDKRYPSRLSPTFTRKYSFFQFIPMDNFRPFQKLIFSTNYQLFPYILLVKTSFFSNRFILFNPKRGNSIWKQVLHPLGNFLYFSPWKKHIKDFFCILLPPKSVSNIAVMTTETLLFTLAFKSFSSKYALMIIQHRTLLCPLFPTFFPLFLPFRL